MEFNFSIEDLAYEYRTAVGSTEQGNILTIDGRQLHKAKLPGTFKLQLFAILDHMGKASAFAQQLPRALTSSGKLTSTGQVLLLKYH